MISGRRCETAPTWKNRQELELLVPTWNLTSLIHLGLFFNFVEVSYTNVNNTIDKCISDCWMIPPFKQFKRFDLKWIEKVQKWMWGWVERQKEARRGGCRLSWDHLSSRRGEWGGVTRHPRLALLCLHMGGIATHQRGVGGVKSWIEVDIYGVSLLPWVSDIIQWDHPHILNSPYPTLTLGTLGFPVKYHPAIHPTVPHSTMDAS